jgi:AcrR family transcriptional regulator
MDAAIRLIVEDGYSTLTMERLAERAGVSKAALYRRWPNKLAVVVDAISSLGRQAITVPDTGRLRDDILEYLGIFSRDQQADLELFDALGAAIGSDPELAAQCKGVLLAQGVAAFRIMVERAVARGELEAGADVELLSEVVPALVLYRRQTTGTVPDSAFIERIVSQFFQPGR